VIANVVPQKENAPNDSGRWPLGAASAQTRRGAENEKPRSGVPQGFFLSQPSISLIAYSGWFLNKIDKLFFGMFSTT
jgi:hypothetical protein